MVFIICYPRALSPRPEVLNSQPEIRFFFQKDAQLDVKVARCWLQFAKPMLSKLGVLFNASCVLSFSNTPILSYFAKQSVTT